MVIPDRACNWGAQWWSGGSHWPSGACTLTRTTHSVSRAALPVPGMCLSIQPCTLHYALHGSMKQQQARISITAIEVVERLHRV